MIRRSYLKRSAVPLKRSWLRPKADPSKKPCPPAEFRREPIVRQDAAGMASLRWQAWERSEGFCEAIVTVGKRESRCMAPITWFRFHLAHTIDRGDGGSDVISNVLCKCPDCHMGGPESDHPQLQWSKKTVESEGRQ